MSNIIVGGEGSKKIVTLFPGADLGRITMGIYEAVGKSFDQQFMRNPTREEIKRRFKIVMDWAVTLRGDLSWGLDRIVDVMHEILTSELTGAKWEPSKRQCWIPADGK